MPNLAVKDIVMEFPAVRALGGVSLSFASGEVHGVIGENGAGKSTLMKILSGLQQPTSGEIYLDDKPVRMHGVRDAISHGIAMIHQELNLVEALTAAENVFLGREIRKGGLLDRRKMLDETAVFLKEVGATFAPDTPVERLSIAGKQLVEIAKALAVDASILIMDEPTAVLSEPESEALFALIRKLKEKGVTVLYISHRLPEVCAICDRISVLRDGMHVETLDGKESNPTMLASLMVGRPLTDVFPEKIAAPTGSPILQAEHIAVETWVHDVSLSVRPGEILGLAGLVGSGRTELCEALVGARPMIRGQIQVDGNNVRIKSPRDAMKHGIAYVSEDRKGLGLILDLSVVHNTTLANLKSYSKFTVDQRAERQSTESWKQDLDIRAGDLDAAVMFLSGGNQQKVSIAKWLETKPRVLILDEPTRGVDVGAKREMYALIQRLAADGMACIVVSSELVEIIGLCHRALVLREGRVMGEVSGESMNEETMMHMAAGVGAA